MKIDKEKNIVLKKGEEHYLPKKEFEILSLLCSVPGKVFSRGTIFKNIWTDKSSKSPSAVPTSSIYHRNFDGAYCYFIQNIGLSKFQLVAKYDWYDPNVKISGQDIGKTGTNTKVGDIRFETIGFGLNYYMNQHVKIMAYYDMVTNETTLLPGYDKDIIDNVFTLRTQFKF